jgi:hypothetical protein
MNSDYYKQNNHSRFFLKDDKVYQKVAGRFVPVNISEVVGPDIFRIGTAFPGDITKELKELSPSYEELNFKDLCDRLSIAPTRPYKFPKE